MSKTIIALAAFILMSFHLLDVAYSANNTDTLSDFKIIQLQSLEGENGSSAAYFTTESQKAVIFAPGSRYGKESFYFLAERLQKLNIASLSTGGSSSDIRNALSFLQNQGFEKISMVGGSMGGESVLDVLKDYKGTLVEKAVLIAPFGGGPIKNSYIKKLFIVAKKDGIVAYSDIDRLYRDSAEPKAIKVYEKSRAHAQELFASKKTKENVTSLIIDFINND